MSKKAGRLYLLDLTRGLAALGVVLWHYQIFYFDAPGHLADDFNQSGQPFFGGLWFFYQEGSRGVYLFFVLSGFVFFAQYVDKIGGRTMSTWQYFIRRFSRLYPLHLVTLVFVYILQVMSKQATGQYSVYHCNDLRRGILSLTFLTDWLPEKYVCSTLNGPTWSLSVEVFLYVLFFAVACLLPKKWLARVGVTVAIIAGSLLSRGLHAYHLLGDPTLCFFSGGFAYLLWTKARHDGRMAMWLLLASTATAAASGVYLVYVSASIVVQDMILFPSVVLALACAQSLKPMLGHSIRSVGDISYSVYLIHFPLQLAIILGAKFSQAHIDYASAHVFVLFFALLIALSYASYYLFEVPLQDAIRRRFARPSAAGAGSGLSAPKKIFARAPRYPTEPF